MTLNEIIYNLRGILKDTKSDDIKITDRQYEFIINYLREKLIVQQSQKKRSLSANVKQDLGAIPVTKIDSFENSVKSKLYIYKTNVRIPQPIELDQKDGITYVGGLDRVSPIAFKTKSYVSRVKHLKHASKETVSYLSDGYLYITTCPNPNLRVINVEGVFLNPRDVYNFKKANGDPCYNPDVDRYPISGRMIDTINDLVKTKELNLLYQILEDTSNDALSI